MTRHTARAYRRAVLACVALWVSLAVVYWGA